MPKGRKRPIDNNPPVEDDDKIDEEAALSNMLFGAEPDVAANNAANDWSGFLQADEQADEDENDDSNDDSDDDSGSKAGVGPAWVDDDDVDVDLRAASRTSKLRKTTEGEMKEEEEEEKRAGGGLTS